MGKDLAAAWPHARAVFELVDAALSDRLSHLCFEGPAETLTLTHNAQPALFAHGVAVWECVAERLRPYVRAAAGHSLGEFTAYCAAGSLSVADGARLVRRRGELMYEAGLARPGTMAAVLGDTTRTIDELCEDASRHAEGGLVVPANYNSPGQVVISGEVAGVEKAMELAKASGAKRAIRLPVSGAFHSPLMAPARDGLAAALRTTTLRPPAVPVYANVTAEPVRDGDRASALLVEQLTAPVRWSQLIERIVADFPDAFLVEMGPGAVLAGLAKKIVPGVEVVTCGTAAEVDNLLSRLPS